MKNSTHQTKILGFTLIELLVTSTILIVLTAIGISSYTKAAQSSRNGRRKADLETIRQALMLYRADKGCYPNTNVYTSMMGAIADYLSETGVIDPKNDSNYYYSYIGNVNTTCNDGTTGVATFTLTARLEPSVTLYNIKSP